MSNTIPQPETPPLIGVNLGGWLVLERWMTPGLFAGSSAPDEQALMHESGAAERVKRHQRTFITEKDFIWLHDHGVTALRIPVGHWIFGDQPPYVRSIERLDWAVKMAERFGMRVIIDLHRAPGSQDGHDNSLGGGHAGWFDDKAAQDETVRLLVRLTERYRQSTAVWGISPLNEPKLSPRRFFVTRRFYRRAYREYAAVARPGMRFVFSDGFVPLLMSGVIKPERDVPAVMDIHCYNFSWLDGYRTLRGQLGRARHRRWLIWWCQLDQPVVIGEWSGVVSGKKMRHVPEKRQKTFEPQYIAAQQQAYRHTVGQFYWSYKTEQRGIWHFRSLVEDGMLRIGDRH